MLTFKGLQHGPLPEERASIACEAVLKDGSPETTAEYRECSDRELAKTDLDFLLPWLLLGGASLATIGYRLLRSDTT